MKCSGRAGETARCPPAPPPPLAGKAENKRALFRRLSRKASTEVRADTQKQIRGFKPAKREKERPLQLFKGEEEDQRQYYLSSALPREGMSFPESTDFAESGREERPPPSPKEPQSEQIASR